MVFILFDFILNIPVNKFSVMSAHSTKIKMRGSRERVLTPSLENRKPLGLFSNTGPDHMENKSYQASIQYWVIIAPPAFCCWADDGPLLVVF